jgi:hypothetical protein
MTILCWEFLYVCAYSFSFVSIDVREFCSITGIQQEFPGPAPQTVRRNRYGKISANETFKKGLYAGGTHRGAGHSGNPGSHFDSSLSGYADKAKAKAADEQCHLMILAIKAASAEVDLKKISEVMLSEYDGVIQPTNTGENLKMANLIKCTWIRISAGPILSICRISVILTALTPFWRLPGWAIARTVPAETTTSTRMERSRIIQKPDNI